MVKWWSTDFWLWAVISQHSANKTGGSYRPWKLTKEKRQIKKDKQQNFILLFLLLIFYLWNMRQLKNCRFNFYFIKINSYSLVPRPIFSAWARHVLYSEFGVVFSKWSWWSQKCSAAIRSESWLFGSGCIFRQASTQAWSSASGSNDANIPIFGRIGASFSGWQSQFGDTSTTSEIWKFGLPSSTAFVYSARCV